MDICSLVDKAPYICCGSYSHWETCFFLIGIYIYAGLWRTFISGCRLLCYCYNLFCAKMFVFCRHCGMIQFLFFGCCFYIFICYGTLNWCISNIYMTWLIIFEIWNIMCTLHVCAYSQLQPSGLLCVFVFKSIW